MAGSSLSAKGAKDCCSKYYQQEEPPYVVVVAEQELFRSSSCNQVDWIIIVISSNDQPFNFFV
jgi:hypothetical protein